MERYDFNFPVYVKNSPIEGLGAFASRPILKGEVVAVEYPMEFLSSHRFGYEEKELDWHYLYDIAEDKDYAVLGTAMFYNHDFDPNLSVIYDFKNREITFIAVRDVQKDEELTNDYSRGWTLVKNIKEFIKVFGFDPK